ncbi:MAG: DUF2953 domain-containing protein [Oscillospiraceae bacterium]|nr:DUF2953 domain-containing protein [Oscillospiraceae bacterium]
MTAGAPLAAGGFIVALAASPWLPLPLLLLSAGLLSLLLTPLGIVAYHHNGQTRVKLKIGFLRVALWPRKAKKPRARPAARRRPKKAAEKGKMLKNLLPGADDAGKLLAFAKKTAGRFFGVISVNRLGLRCVMGSSDAAATALNYGRLCALVHTALPLLREAVNIRRESIDITPDFQAGKSDITFIADITLTLASLIGFAALTAAGAAGYILKKTTTHYKEKAVR